MLTIEQLKQIVHSPGVTKTECALLCVAAGGGSVVPTRMVRQFAVEAGVKSAKTINFSAHLSATEDKVFNSPKGWELTAAGRQHVAALIGKVLSVSPAASEAQSLRALLPKLKSDPAREFLTEAIVCAEQSLFRASVVLSWSGAIAILQDVAARDHLAALNAEATKRDDRWRSARKSDDLGKLKESVFLDICESVGLFGKSVKQELDVCLRLRNSCGHPNALRIGTNKVAAHLETLALNVFAVYG